jgi:hypothetical protein
MGRELGIVLLIGAGLYTACELILLVLGIYRISGLNPIRYMVPAIAMALSTSIFEELLFRGVLFRSIEMWFGSWAALVLSHSSWNRRRTKAMAFKAHDSRLLSGKVVDETIQRTIVSGLCSTDHVLTDEGRDLAGAC